MRTPYRHMPFDTWAVVLAAGEGTRLAGLTTDDSGNTIPKQFCSVDGGASMLEVALRRARRIVPRQRVCMVVAQHHEPYWHAARTLLPAGNLIVEPSNRGTAVGILHGLLHILQKDPQARIVFLPADHHVRNERLLTNTVRNALRLLRAERRELLLVGIEPTDAESEFGYILPGPMEDGARRVAEFIEKPPVEHARELVARGALWNSFIFASRGKVLEDLLAAQIPGLSQAMLGAMSRRQPGAAGSHALDELYAQLTVRDFSREILQTNREFLRVVAAPSCGWSDLGTPRRIATLVEQMRGQVVRVRRLGRRPVAPLINLIANYTRRVRTA